MLKKTLLMTTTLPIALGVGDGCFADETQNNFSAFIGLRLWRNEWTFPGLAGNGRQFPLYHSADAELTFIPVLSARYKNFFVSGSYFPKTNYSFNGQEVFYLKEGKYTPSINAVEGERTEWDINAGYYVLPSLTVTLGYKYIERDFTIIRDGERFENIATQNTSGPILGMSAGTPLSGKFGVYGSFAFGRLMTDWENRLEYDTNYYLGELGLSYFSKLNSIPMFDLAYAHIGYRFQALIENYTALDSGTNSADYTQGFVL